MKTHSIEWSNIDSRDKAELPNPIASVNTALSLAGKAFIALVPAFAIVVGAAWLVAVPELVVYLQATLWASGFVFLGLAIESQKPAVFPALATGIALPVLAILSSKVAVEIAVIAAALVAVWVAVALFRR